MQSEADFQNAVYETARIHGWLISHFGFSETPGGRWRTTTRYDAKGFPDLVLAHPKHGILFRELKSDHGTLSKHQIEWLDLLYTAGGDSAVWRPRDWPKILAQLKGEATIWPSSSAS